MLIEKYKEELPALMNIKCRPCVSIIMPFEPKMYSKMALTHSLKIAANKIKHELYLNYAQNVADEVLDKLMDVINHLDYTTHKKSIAVFVSPEIKKAYYLDILVNEKVMVDSSFEIRDIVLNKQDKHEFLLLVISGKKEKIYFGNLHKLQLIVSNNAEHVHRDMPEPVANFTDAATVKETGLKRFLHYIDNGLSYTLKYYPLPLFVLSTKKTMGYFKTITKHNRNITGFIHGNFEDATESELISTIKPQLHNWNTIKEIHLMNYLKIAEDNLNLATGIHDVWLHANRRYKQLLVVEKNFYCPAFVTGKGETIFCNSNNDENIIAKDAVDDIIEKVLEHGGDVEFVDELKDYNHIALAEYYHNS
jgi:hypothetical protein